MSDIQVEVTCIVELGLLLTLYSSTASSQVRTSAESSHISASVGGFVAFLAFPMPADFISFSMVY